MKNGKTNLRLNGNLGIFTLTILLTLLSVTAFAQPITELKPIDRNADMSVFVNQVGFRLDAAKYCTFPASESMTFEVINAATNQVAYNGTMAPAGNDFGPHVTGEFSAFRTPGLYYVRVGSARSYPFRIADDVYDGPMKLILHYFSRQRCGASTTGYLTPCHTEDGIRVDNGQRQDVSGGWHDASDLRKWVSATLYGMVGILGMTETLRGEWDNPAVTEELLWGNRYFLAMQEPAGYVMDHVGGDLFHHSDSNYWSDNISGTDDDRVIQTRPVDDASQFTFATVEAQMYHYMAAKDPDYAKRCLDAAVRCYEWCVANIRDYTTGVAGSGLLAAIELYKATGTTKYKTFAYEMAGRIVAAQVSPKNNVDSPAGFFHTRPGSDSYYAEIARTDFAFVGLAKLILHFRKEDNSVYKASVERYCNDYLTFIAEKNAFGLVPYEIFEKPTATARRTGDYWYKYFMDPTLEWWVGNNANITGKAIGLVMASVILDNKDLQKTAQRQLDWVLGANPFATATMRGVGYEHPAFATAFYKDWERPGSEFFPPTPHIPGAVLNGIGGDLKDMPDLIDGSWQTGEYWTPMVGLTLWLMAELTNLN